MRLKKTLAVVAVMTVAASMAAPAALAKGNKGKGGKKAIGEVTGFDATTGALVVTLTDGTVFAGTANEGTKVKIEHRGNHGKGKGHGNPSNGDLADLVAGAKVLKMKTADDGLTVKKIRLRPVAAAPVAEEPAAEAPAVEDELAEEEPVEEEPVDEGTGDGDAGDGGTVVDCLLTPEALECVAPVTP